MLNGELVDERSKPNAVLNSSTRIAALAPSDEKAVEIAYLAVLSRRPDGEEYAYFTDLLANSRGEVRAQRMGDLFWTLLNSSEFSWNH